MWIPLLAVVVIAVGGFAVWRIRGIFGSHQLPTYAGSMTDDKNNSNPKHLVYEIFGPAGTVADINYVDQEGDLHQLISVPTPWSTEVITTAPSMTGNIVAQGNTNGLGCRITANGEVKQERYSNEVNAYVYCFVKSA